MKIQEVKTFKFTCIDCKQDFNPPNWECFAGVKHQVEPKRYYMADAPTVSEWRDGRPFINKGAARTIILNMPPEKQIREGEQVTRIPGGSVEFVRGLFETGDPELQFHLDRKDGLCSKERWEDVYINDDERIQMRSMELKAREQRLQDRENELLGMVKAKA
jgi:hypothetical protein